MISSRKRQLEIALILACLCAPALYAALDEGKTGPKFETAEKEPNEPRPEVKIEISDKLEQWFLAQRYPGRGPIKPTHVAELFIWDLTRPPVTAKEFLNSSAARSMTRKQLDFLEGSDAFVMMGSDQTVRNHDHFRLYAVSEEDVRKMIEAFIEILSEKSTERRRAYVAERRKLQEKMAQAKDLLPEKEGQLPAAKAVYDKIKEIAHSFSADNTEAVEHAKRTMLEMSKMLETLDVELAGIREKLNVINDYWSKRGEMSEAARGKLQEMEIEQMVELKGAEARKKAGVAIQRREKEFLELFNQWADLNNEVERLKSTIDSCEKNLAKLEDALANPTPDMLPPKIYQNKVVIYPVRTD